jgi:hypothetical protein
MELQYGQDDDVRRFLILTIIKEGGSLEFPVL